MREIEKKFDVKRIFFIFLCVMQIQFFLRNQYEVLHERKSVFCEVMDFSALKASQIFLRIINTVAYC